MKQLELFATPVISNECERSILLNTKSSKTDRSLTEKQFEMTVEPALTTDRLAHYRAKLAKLDATGYDEVAEVITSDTIHGHNQLGRDMKIVGTLRRLQWTPEAIATYFLTRRIKNNRSAKQ